MSLATIKNTPEPTSISNSGIIGVSRYLEIRKSANDPAVIKRRS
jgi:hypothetical protein